MGTPTFSSYDSLFASVASSLDAIAGPGTMEQLHAVFDRLPGSITHQVQFEVREARPGADLLALLHPTNALGAGVVADLAGGDERVARTLGELLVGAATVDDSDPCACDDVWAEWDVGGVPNSASSGGLPVPALFCAPRRAEPPHATDLHGLLGAGAPDAFRAAEIERRMWPTAQAFSRGAMYSRADHPFRLCLRCDDPREVLAELGRWTEDRSSWDDIARAALADAAAFGEAGCVLDVEIRHGFVEPAIGVEVTTREAGDLDYVLGFLERQGRADPTWLARLTSWPGDTIARNAEEAERLAVSPPRNWFGRTVEFGTIRRINHVKLNRRHGAAPEVKAYLCIHAGHRVVRAPQTVRTVGGAPSC